MIKPYAVHVDRGFYGCSVFIPPIHLAFETEAEARAEYARQIDMQKSEMARTEGKPICNIRLLHNQMVLLNQVVEKSPDGFAVHEGIEGSVC